MREWVFVHNEILDILKELKIPLGTDADDGLFQRPLCRASTGPSSSGYLSNIAVHKEGTSTRRRRGGRSWSFPDRSCSTQRGLDRGRGDGPDKPPVRPDGGPDRPGWLEALGGELCRYPSPVRAGTRGTGQVVADRAGDALRPGDRRGQDRSLRPDRSRGSPPPISSARLSSAERSASPSDSSSQNLELGTRLRRSKRS